MRANLASPYGEIAPQAEISALPETRSSPATPGKISIGAQIVIYSFAARSRRALTMTDTELRDMARAAMTGLSMIPKLG